MSFDLDPPYDDEIEQWIAEMASTIRILNPELYESDGDSLFALLVRGTRIYVEAWVESGGASDSLAGHVLTGEDLADPDRASDPHATFISLLELTLDAIHDNIRGELDPDYGRS